VGQRDLLGHLEQRKCASCEHLGPDGGVGLHVFVLGFGQLAGLAEYGVGDGDLAEVVQGAASRIRSTCALGNPRRWAMRAD
jgi:hypothetical protein